jgi:GDP-D-mannose dehydratase
VPTCRDPRKNHGSIGADRLRGGKIAKAVGNTAKARKLLGWVPEIPLEKSLEVVLQVARQNISHF